jgi:CelD/BcsL family acetyltransferase involved in cellulose biosynthesis
MEHASRDGYRVAFWPTVLSPFLTLPAPEQDPFGNCPERYKSARKGLDRYFRRLQQLGEPRFEVISEFSEEVFNEFLDLEAAGWKKLKGGAIKCNPVVAEFYRTVLRETSSRQQLRISSLLLGDTRVAMELAFILGNQCFSPKIAYNEHFARCAPGQLLARYCIQDLVQRGVARYDLLGAQARHKAMWAGEVRPHQNCYIFRPSLQGAAYHSIAARIAPRIKRLKHRLYGDPQSLEKTQLN